jgi:hypothetical protein
MGAIDPSVVKTDLYFHVYIAARYGCNEAKN